MWVFIFSHSAYYSSNNIIIVTYTPNLSENEIHTLLKKYTYSIVYFFRQRNMRSVSIGGAGLIVGTALSVIIPEGVHAIYDNGKTQRSAVARVC